MALLMELLAPLPRPSGGRKMPVRSLVQWPAPKGSQFVFMAW